MLSTITDSAADHKQHANKSKSKNFSRLNPVMPSIAGIMLRTAGMNRPTKIT